jgi:ABC-type sugar transport system ATPase subunit
MDEPTRGVDVGSKYEIYTIINNMAKKGATVLFISSEMEELMGICDRIMVMSKGKIVAEIPKSDYSQEKIISYALGGEN